MELEIKIQFEQLMKPLKKIVIAFVALVILSAIFHFWAKYRIESSTPPFIAAKLNELMDSKELMDSIGGSPQFEFSYNKNDYKIGQMVKYTIRIRGRSRTLIYEGLQVKTGNKWIPSEEKLIVE